MSDTPNRYSHMTGNQYAKKYDRPANASLSLRCNESDKYQWKLKAEMAGKSLNEWVIERLNLSIDRVA